MAELGRIDKPSAGEFRGKRKLYCVASVYPLKEAPEEYGELVARYWEESSRQTEKLEASGAVRKIFCESIYAEGEKALEALETVNALAHRMVKKRVEAGAAFLPLESREIFGPFLDWANCLNVVRTEEVFSTVFGFYNELLQKRLARAAEVIDQNLEAEEAGLLILRDEDRVRLQFPPDIEVFLVTPPSYDDIARWLREKMGSLRG
ncbi:MAG: hypothetical protein Kow0025_07860 [Thermodesulfovibrionales bacterium]